MSSKYQVTISRAQQIALQKGCGPVPLPSKQLEIMNAKKDKEPRMHLSFAIVHSMKFPCFVFGNRILAKAI